MVLEQERNQNVISEIEENAKKSAQVRNFDPQSVRRGN